MASNIAYVNFLSDGSIPQVFNPLTFKSSTIQSEAVATGSLTVSAQTVTNGIADYASIDARRISVNNQASFTGTLVPNSSCLATTFYVDDKINTILGGGNINTLLDSISEINTALNSDPDFANTVGLRIGQVEVSAQNNANQITQLDSSLDTINETLLDLDSRLVLDRTDIDSIEGTLTSVQSQTSTNTANIATNTLDISGNKVNIAANTSAIATSTSYISANTSAIATNTSNIATNTSAIATNTANIATNTSTLVNHP